MSDSAQTTARKNDTLLAIILAISLGHFLNDVMQSMLPAIYPVLSKNYGLTLFQVGLITAVYQMTGSVLQPVIGIYTDKRPLPWSLPFSAAFTMAGLLLLANAHHYYMLLAGAACVGFGSSIFHPEASRVARLASGGRHGFAQSVFQVGGNTGSAIGPLLAAIFISRQQNISLFAALALVGMVILSFVSRWYAANLKKPAGSKAAAAPLPDKKNVRKTLFILVALMFAKYIYLASMSNFYTFFAIEKFNISTQAAQYLLFLYLGGIAVGTVFGGPIGDRIGTRSVIWFSILGVLPFTLALPHVSLPVMAVLSVIIGMILASAFPAIIVTGQELIPGRIGTVAGLFFGLSFGIGSISSVALGKIGDITGLQTLFTICSFLPLLGMIAMFLPKKSH
ncbi:MAG: Major facilitator superfamily protein [Candidatus Tokpelaia hoelldobleri]|uniref:Major facilitator superfamily protein n=1 Tax=Candidatus Tokpelaia hoelldobleri TaxID=1902579 RepID=A0A1U9JVR2_9HYPH|nr:MAG: Major facilitator superfamily protein [Candidatus Tokpelaia hoelldoblerii]